MSEHILTYSKLHFTPTKPIADDIRVEDIAHALSLLCRANGHFKSFFSVAQHSINCSLEALERGCSKRIQLACLLHDASEAYISDITRPVKQFLPQYLEIEKRLQEEIWNKFLLQPLCNDEKRQVFEIDDAMLYLEFKYFMDEKVLDDIPNIISVPSFKFEDFDVIEKKFISMLNQLICNANLY